MKRIVIALGLAVLSSQNVFAEAVQIADDSSTVELERHHSDRHMRKLARRALGMSRHEFRHYMGGRHAARHLGPQLGAHIAAAGFGAHFYGPRYGARFYGPRFGGRFYGARYGHFYGPRFSPYWGVQPWFAGADDDCGGVNPPPADDCGGVNPPPADDCGGVNPPPADDCTTPASTGTMSDCPQVNSLADNCNPAPAVDFSAIGSAVLQLVNDVDAISQDNCNPANVVSLAARLYASGNDLYNFLASSGVSQPDAYQRAQEFFNIITADYQALVNAADPAIVGTVTADYNQLSALFL